MKKFIFLLATAFCMISIVYAVATIIVTDTVKPSIEATFNESVTITDYYLEYTATGNLIELDYVSLNDQNKIFSFTPKIPLVNGYYFFKVDAKDEAGNPKIFVRNVIINVNETTIRYINPVLGISSQAVFDVVVGTSRPASCRWSNFDKPYSEMVAGSFTRTGNTMQHTISSFMSAQDIQNKQDDALLPKIYIACIDNLEREVRAELPIGYDLSPPAFSVAIDGLVGGKVINHPPQATVRIVPNVLTGDRVVCTIKDTKTNIITTFTGQDRYDITTYKKDPRHKLTYPDDVSSNGDYNYVVTCDNLAWLPASQTIKITVDLDEGLVIVVNRPEKYIPGTGETGQLVYDITTSKQAQCRAILDSDDESILSPDDAGTRHTLLYGPVAKGSHIVRFICDADVDSKSLDWPFFVDVTPPTAPKANATACVEDKIELAFSSEDNESQIKGFNYTVYSGTEKIVPMKFTPINKDTAAGLSLVIDKQYVVDVTAINGAGKTTLKTAAAVFSFNPNITLECQEKDPPTVTLNLTDVTGGKHFELLCFDNSGCDPLSIRYGLTENSNCTADIYGTGTTIYEPQTICWKAADKWGNLAEGSQFITFKVLADTCSNNVLDGDESDVDCGGDCLGCVIGENCNSDSDCNDFYCDNGICEEPLCNDGIKNGFETDVDCGGTKCVSCPVGADCLVNGDCLSNSCILGSCEETLCTDGIENGFETDVDCGGKDCSPCPVGSSCVENSDCGSGSCQFSSCVAGEKTFEEWAVENGLDPDDKDGDADGDGLSNYDEFLYGTDPWLEDTDGDGYSDYEEIQAGTDPLDSFDFPVTYFYRYTLLIIGILILSLGLLMLYYLKVDKNTSLNIIIIGAAALLFVIIDWFLFLIPKPILIGVSIAAFGGAGYLAYTKQDMIIKGFSGKGAAKIPSAEKVQTAVGEMPAEMKRAARPSRKEIEESRIMAEMIKKEKAERERKREKLFSEFSGKGKAEPQRSKRTSVIEPIKKTKVVKKKEIIKKPSPAEKVKIKKEAADMERLAKLVEEKGIKGLDRFNKREAAFEKLSKLSSSKINELFRKLPSSEKDIDSLLKLAKEDERKNKKTSKHKK